MDTTATLRQQAKEKRLRATLVRNAAIGLSLAADRELMIRHANELEAEAVLLEAQADALLAKGTELVKASTTLH